MFAAPGFRGLVIQVDSLPKVFTSTHSEHGPKLAVVYLIPGEGFFCDGSNDYDPEKLFGDGNIVFVSLNYRLPVFG